VLQGDFIWVEKERRWYDSKGHLLFDERRYKAFHDKVRAECGFTFDHAMGSWVDAEGKKVWDLQCGHLVDGIRGRFGIEIKDRAWAHPNGGVFVFDASGADFMEAWHTHAMEIFNDGQWAVRDQGVLAATLWEFGMQDNKRLPRKFNFIVDYNDAGLVYHGNLKFSRESGGKVYAPCLVHVYHEFGNPGWNIWQDIARVWPPSPATTA